MKSLFEEMGGTYRQEGDYLIPNLALPDEPEYQIGKYGRMHRSYLKEHRPVLYANLLTCGALHRHLAEIDQACNERISAFGQTAKPAPRRSMKPTRDGAMTMRRSPCRPTGSALSLHKTSGFTM